ncbi:MAG: hypothetical protein QNK23_12205 [Crocinitomicaceae bacterium]|nr:hypothetical protein [Crocinitomicaceae bacterium]
MENGNNSCTNSELVLNVKSKKSRSFKAGSELSAKVNLVDVEVVETLTEDFELTEINLQFKMDACYVQPVSCEE